MALGLAVIPGIGKTVFSYTKNRTDVSLFYTQIFFKPGLDGLFLLSQMCFPLHILPPRIEEFFLKNGPVSKLGSLKKGNEASTNVGRPEISRQLKIAVLPAYNRSGCAEIGFTYNGCSDCFTAACTREVANHRAGRKFGTTYFRSVSPKGDTDDEKPGKQLYFSFINFHPCLLEGTRMMKSLENNFI